MRTLTVTALPRYEPHIAHRRGIVLGGAIATWPLDVLFWALLDSSHQLIPLDHPQHHVVSFLRHIHEVMLSAHRFNGGRPDVLALATDPGYLFEREKVDIDTTVTLNETAPAVALPPASGEVETEVELRSIRRFDAGLMTADDDLKEGQSVEVRYKMGKQWYPATIAKPPDGGDVGEGGRYTVQYDRHRRQVSRYAKRKDNKELARWYKVMEERYFNPTKEGQAARTRYMKRHMALAGLDGPTMDRLLVELYKVRAHP